MLNSGRECDGAMVADGMSTLAIGSSCMVVSPAQGSEGLRCLQCGKRVFQRRFKMPGRQPASFRLFQPGPATVNYGAELRASCRTNETRREAGLKHEPQMIHPSPADTAQGCLDAPAGQGETNMAKYTGNDFNNTINGTSSSDVINGMGGADSLYGLGSRDWIYGGAGNDLIRGGDAQDFLYGQEGSDQIYGDLGDDFLYGDGGNDSLFGKEGNDGLYSGDGDDHAVGGDGDDYVYGDAGNDHLEGNDGHDKLIGGAGNDDLEGGYGDDRLEGGEGDDTLHAGGGNNVLLGGAGNDNLSTGGSGAWLGATSMYGGTGNDSYYITRVSSSTVVDDVVPQVIEYGDQGIDNITLDSSFFNEMWSYKMPENVENLRVNRHDEAHLWTTPHQTARIVGNGMDNLITGTNEGDVLEGGNGNDQLMSRLAQNAGVAAAPGYANEQDVMSGGNGNDKLIEIQGDRVQKMEGGAGNDLFIFSDRGYAGTDKAQFAGWAAWESAGQGWDTVQSATASTFLASGVDELKFTGTALNTHLWGNELNNVVTGGANSNDEIRGYAGDDVLDGGVGEGNDVIDGGIGNDLLRGHGGNDQLFGGSGQDFLFAGTGSDLLYGGAGNDELQGEEGMDHLEGGDGNDWLLGGAGVDWLVGGKGWDNMTGGAGNDNFVFNTVLDSYRQTDGTTGIDTITDFQSGDKIDLRSIDAKINVAGDQAFFFRGLLGHSTGTTPGELVVSYEGGNTWVRGDVNGDHVAELELMLTGTIALTGNDFLL
ncbi:calcium-binding protein [Ramlibacter sp. WS9]|nr:calcium-binding protein [Ramlibacter sp. WS9]